MRIGTFAAGCAALLLFGWTLAPVEATARGGFRAGGAFVGKFAGARLHHFGRFRGFNRFGRLPYIAVATSGGGWPVADNAVLWVGNSNPPPPIPEPPYQRVCVTQPHNVPSEAGGIREIRVTRCFKEYLVAR